MPAFSTFIFKWLADSASSFARWAWRKRSISAEKQRQARIADANDPIDGLLIYIGDTRRRWRFLGHMVSQSAPKTLTSQLKYQLLFAYLGEETDVVALAFVAEHLNQPKCRVPFDECPIIYFDLVVLLGSVVSASARFTDIASEQRIKPNEAFLRLGIGLLLIVAKRQQERPLFPCERDILAISLQALSDSIVVVRKHDIEKLHDLLPKLIDAAIGATRPIDFANAGVARSFYTICDELCHSLKALGEHDFSQWCAVMQSLCAPRDDSVKLIGLWKLIDLNSPSHASAFVHRFFDEACSALLLPFGKAFASGPDVHEDSRTVASHLHMLISYFCKDSNHNHKIWQSSVIAVIEKALHALERTDADDRVQEHFRNMLTILKVSYDKVDWAAQQAGNIDAASIKLQQSKDMLLTSAFADAISTTIPPSRQLPSPNMPAQADAYRKSQLTQKQEAYFEWERRGKPQGREAEIAIWLDVAKRREKELQSSSV